MMTTVTLYKKNGEVVTSEHNFGGLKYERISKAFRYLIKGHQSIDYAVIDGNIKIQNERISVIK